jgi:hypothetical protein
MQARNSGSSVSIETGLQAGRPGFASRHGAMMGFSSPPRPDRLCGTQWVPAAVSPGVKRPASEADCSPPSNAEVKNSWNSTYTRIAQWYSAGLGAG